MRFILIQSQLLNVLITLNLRYVFFYLTFFMKYICFCHFILIIFTNVKLTLIN